MAASAEGDETNSLLVPKREISGDPCSQPPGFLPGVTPLATGDVIMLTLGLYPRPCPSGSALGGCATLILGHGTANMGLKGLEMPPLGAGTGRGPGTESEGCERRHGGGFITFIQTRFGLWSPLSPKGFKMPPRCLSPWHPSCLCPGPGSHCPAL